jgi:hypothetical protein
LLLVLPVVGISHSIDRAWFEREDFFEWIASNGNSLIIILSSSSSSVLVNLLDLPFFGSVFCHFLYTAQWVCSDRAQADDCERDGWNGPFVPVILTIHVRQIGITRDEMAHRQEIQANW